MPRHDSFKLPIVGGPNGGVDLLRAVLVSFALLIVHAAAAEEMKGPHLAVAKVDWEAAAASLAEKSAGTPAEAFAALNAATRSRFPDLAKSAVPVLMPLDIDDLRKQRAAGKTDLLVDNFLRGGFHATAFFQAGPAGFDIAFSLRPSEVPELSEIRYPESIYVLLSGLGMTYELDGAPLPEGEPVKSLETDYPGIRRVLHESYIRYVFQRYGVTYVAAIYCLDTRPRSRIVTCQQADRIAERFLRGLTLVGGTPAPAREAEPPALDRPQEQSKEFTYFSPGSLIPRTGLRPELGGRADYTVYAHLRFPMKQAPAFANSQSFNNWGDCDFTGRSRGRVSGKGTPYSCKVNGQPLVFDESRNYAYPWRDNFCEHRRFFVGQCPGGEGHQGQDIRPSNCTLFNEGADRCLPYQHDLVAVHDGMILRAHKQEAVYLFVNTASTHLRVRYMHMNPSQLDADGIVSGKEIAAGDTLGKVGNYNKKERGTTYHLHFDMQVPTKIGYVFVNPYSTLVAAYERLIGARGVEIKDGDPVPASVVVAPVIEHPAEKPATVLSVPPAPALQNAAVQGQETTVVRATAELAKEPAKETAKKKTKETVKERPPRRHVRHRHRHRHRQAAND
jgi:murein DD-endopeptidase MepM/ murein hydrolase activator NlpD